MIVSCPSCRTRYRVGTEELVSGRTLRCANCGHSWEYVALPPVPSPAPSPAPEAPRRAPSSPSQRRAQPSAAVGRSGRAAAFAFFGVVLLFAVALALYAGRYRLVALWPPAARLYAFVGAAPQPLGAGLKIGDITPKRTVGGLVIEGQVTNTSSVEREVPALRIALRDAKAKEVEFKIIMPPKARLLPGEVETFTTAFKHPSNAATRVDITFAHS